MVDARAPPRIRGPARLTRFASTVLYVVDVPAALVFYERAFGLSRRHLDEHENGSYGELQTGSTVLGFASHELAARHLRVQYTRTRPAGPPPGFEIGLVVSDLAAAYAAALAAGAQPVAPPEPKPWGRSVAFVRDLDGALVELASEDGDV